MGRKRERGKCQQQDFRLRGAEAGRDEIPEHRNEERFVARWSTAASQDDHICSFANDARTIYVKIGDRKVPSNTPIVTWAAKPANTVKFKRADEGQSGSLVAKDDGLYLMKGFIILVR